MKVAILGYGAQGQAAYHYWRDGHEITICDEDESLPLPNDVEGRLGTSYLHGLDQFDLIVRSPSVHPQAIVDANSPDILEKVTTVTNEFFRVCPSHNLIGVTGTKGKGTTSTLIAKMLEADGQRVHLGGNIGTPPLDLLQDGIQPADWIVLELANFQLTDLHYAPHIAICLMVVPEHLDWHADSEEYFNAKSQLFRNQTSDDIAIYYADNENSQRIASTSPGWKVPYMAFPGARVEGQQILVDNQPVCRTDELKLLGQHNWQNVCAAVTAVWKVTQNLAAIRLVLTSFSGLEHRLELVRELNGVRYYNDSFGNNLHATEVAAEAIKGKKVMIIGGYERHLDIDHFGSYATAHQDEFRKLLLIGESAERLADTLQKAGFENYLVNRQAKTMTAVVKAAVELAQPGDAIVLSPGFASFDMFKNFEERGRQFKAVVQQL